MTTLELNTKYTQLKAGDRLTRYKGFIVLNNTPMNNSETRLYATHDEFEPISVNGSLGLMAAMNEVFAKIDALTTD